MTTLQLSPIGGVVTAAAGASSTGEAASSPNSDSKSSSSKPAAVKPLAAAVAAEAARATTGAQADAQQAAQAADARAAVRVETPPLSLNVGIIGGTFDVYVDLTDPVDNRVVARLYGPRGGTSAPPHPAPAKVRTEA
jgi:hypothetical protein